MGILESNRAKPYSWVKEAGNPTLNFHAFGTSCQVKFSAHEDGKRVEIGPEVISWISHFEERYSRYLPNSWLSEVNRASGVQPVPLGKGDHQILQAASFSFFQSQRSIDPSCLPLTQLWQEAKAQTKVPAEARITEAQDLVNWENVEYSEDEIYLPNSGMGLDFGGFGKEFAVDQVSKILKELDCEDYLIDFGGDIYASGKATDQSHWVVGIEVLGGGEKAVYMVNLIDQAIATSGNYRKFFDLNGKRYGHTLDHRTGYPTIFSDLSASVISPSCLKSGILSTTCLLQGVEAGMRMLESEWDAEGCMQSLDSRCISNKFHKYVIRENYR